MLRFSHAGELLALVVILYVLRHLHLVISHSTGCSDTTLTTLALPITLPYHCSLHPLLSLVALCSLCSLSLLFSSLFSSLLFSFLSHCSSLSLFSFLFPFSSLPYFIVASQNGRVTGHLPDRPWPALRAPSGLVPWHRLVQPVPRLNMGPWLCVVSGGSDGPPPGPRTTVGRHRACPVRLMHVDGSARPRWRLVRHLVVISNLHAGETPQKRSDRRTRSERGSGDVVMVVMASLEGLAPRFFICGFLLRGNLAKVNTETPEVDRSCARRLYFPR